jgi:hypothetical protein
MTYVSGGLIQATDYNGFVATSANNINNVWGTGSGDKGWGQTDIAQVSAGGTVTATQWATLVANLATAGQQTNSTLTSRTQPVAGNTISILANVATDINTITLNRGNAVAQGTANGTFTGTTTKTTATGSGTAAWTITFTHTVTFASANAARYFFNAGGLVKLMYAFPAGNSAVTDHDQDWYTFAGLCGNIFLGGYVNSQAATIAGTSYTGTTRIGGTGGTQTTLATTTGFYQLTTTPATIFQLNNTVSPYTPEYIRTTASVNANASPTVITLTTTWVDDGSATTAPSNISGGVAIASPATAITGTTAGPTTLVNYIPPSTTYLTASWGTPAIAASVA